ncbi:hypothetical protein BBK14_23225 [Parafrankia soli]|uniref:Uncharacterized protein n=1 Tax=Parafrankia soli TaxID=2599596 RepID=A0A1S1PTR1_9ACTN|nr:hypothetical protein BBK14_23225 [Parafrankia soli]
MATPLDFPVFELAARPGAHMAFYSGDNPEGKSLRELTGTPMRSIPAFREPKARLFNDWLHDLPRPAPTGDPL